MKIKVKLLHPKCRLEKLKKGEWIDLRAAQNIVLDAPKIDVTSGEIIFDRCLVPLGIAIELPKYFEANIVVRSSTFKTWQIIQSNGVGIIDSSYCGDKDEWKLPIIAFAYRLISEGDRICQFRIRPSQFAPWWVKLRWLFTTSFKIEYVDSLNNVNRGGFGKSGKN